MMPSVPPSIISAADIKYSSAMFARSNFQNFRMTKAGSVKMAPAATDSPIDPTVRAKFSSRIDPLNSRSTAIPMTAAGYVAAMVMPARRPRYALAAPRTTHMTQAQDEGPHREFALVGRVGHVRARGRRPLLAWSRRSAS